MRALVYKQPHSVEIEAVEAPKIEESTDAVLRLTTAAICAGDMHMYEGGHR